MYVVKTGKMELTRYITCTKCESVLSYNGHDVIVSYDTPYATITMGIRCPVCGEYIPLKFNEVNEYDY